MPIYEYQCTTCGHDFDKLQKIGADAPPCPECGAAVRKKVSASAFVLKGSGWYRDHYGLKKGSTGSADSAAGGSSADSGESSKSTSTTESSASSASAKSSSTSEG